MRLVGGIRLPPALGDDLSVPHDHHAVQRVNVLFGLVHESQQSGRRDTLCFRRAPREREGRVRGRMSTSGQP